jgi:DNA-binding XRE family transcriptional regulator
MNQIQKTNQNHGDKWLQKANYRKSNKKWLGYSRKIALRILAAMEDIPKMTQKSLAKSLDVSPQHINKIIKGQENLTLQTIAKFSDILGVELIAFPAFKYNNSINIMFAVSSNGTAIVVMYDCHIVNDYYHPIEFPYKSPVYGINTGQMNLTI